MIKTIEKLNIEEFDNAVNEFAQTHNVFATQTHIRPTNGALVAVIFYK